MAICYKYMKYHVSLKLILQPTFCWKRLITWTLKFVDMLNPHSTGRRFRYAHGDLGFSLKLFQIAAEA